MNFLYGWFEVDIKSLRLFLGVLEHGSITRAAERLHIAQPALGLHIRRLEEELGVTLVQRHSRGITPTEAGLLLAKHAEQIIRQFDRAKQDMLDYAGAPRGSIAVGLTPTSSHVIATALAARIKEQYPKIKLSITESLSEGLAELLAGNVLDIAVTYNPSGGQDLVFRPLATEAIHFVYRKAAGAVFGPTVTLAEALSHPLVLPGRPHLLRVLIDEHAEEQGLSAQVVYEVNAVATIREFVRAGLACTALPYGAVATDVEAGFLQTAEIVQPKLLRNLYVSYSSRRPPSVAMDIVRKEIEDIIAEMATRGGAGWQLREASVQG